MKALKTLLGLGLAALISCSQSDESILAKKAKKEFLRNENEVYQKYKEDKRAKPIGYRIDQIVKSDNVDDLGEFNVGWAAKNCQLNATVEYYMGLEIYPRIIKFEGTLEIAWVDLAVKCPEKGCYFSNRDYVTVEYGFVKDKNNKWCSFMHSFKFDNKYMYLPEESIKNYKKL